MYIKDIKLENFRNYDKEELKLSPKINIIFGDNAQGKTNILEAIFLCSLGKSFRTNKDKELIKLDKDYSKIEINSSLEDRDCKINYYMKEKKSFSINGIQVSKTSQILGKLYTVLFTPEDIYILNNEPLKRRRFLNIMISQLRPLYVNNLNTYNKALEQRNLYLKQIKFEKKDEKMLEIWDEQISKLNTNIYNYRKEFIKKLNEKIKKIHLKTTENQENIEIKYITNVNENCKEKLKINRNIDINKGFSTIGVHRDDFEIYINKKPLSIYGSQGQKRTAIISLKLAEAEIIHDEVNEYPIILLDDFMSELDKNRIKNLFENIEKNQVIITCTEDFNVENLEKNSYKIKKGTIEKI